MKILNKIKQVSKAYTEGLYSDTPANRKLGRVGMSYSAYTEKIKEKDIKESKQFDNKFIPITVENISFDNKNSIDIYRKGSIYGSGESGTDTPILNKNKEIIGYLQKREAGISGRWSWDYSFEKDKENTIGTYETKKEAIEYFIKKYNNNIEDESKEETNWAASITRKEDKDLAIQAASKIINLGLELPKLSYKPIPKQYNFMPISGYEKSSDTLLLNKNINLTEKGKEYANKGWNSQNNPILHELSHYLAYKFNPILNNKDTLNIKTKELLDKVKNEVSEYAIWNQGEFSAELIAGILSGKRYSKEIMNIVDLKLNPDGKTPEEIFEKGIDFAKRSKEAWERIQSRIK